MNGTIKKLVSDRNFGFITPSDGSKDLFFHASGLEGADFSELREGDAVTFEIGETPKGPAATQVRKA
jgi:cold shock protein